MHKRLLKHKREAVLKTFDHSIMQHRMRIYQLLQQPLTPQTSLQLDVVLDDLTRQLQRDVPARLNYLLNP